MVKINKIYIIGPVGSGKTTLARKLSDKTNIKMYELDKIVWDDDKGNIKREDTEINRLFSNIIENQAWIIEDVGREIFIKGIKEAEIVYYINLPTFIIYKRCIFRWIKQKIGIESYNYKPTIKSLIEMLKWAKQDIKNKKYKMDYIKENSDKYEIIDSKIIRKMI